MSYPHFNEFKGCQTHFTVNKIKGLVKIEGGRLRIWYNYIVVESQEKPIKMLFYNYF